MTNQAPSFDNRYVILRSGKNNAHRLRLPVVIGQSPLCDVIINSSKLADAAQVIQCSEQNTLELVHLQSGAVLPASALNSFGLSVQGPFAGNPNETSCIKRTANELLVREQALFAQLPAHTQKIFGGALPQKLRLGVFATALLAAFFWLISDPSKNHPQLHHVANPLTWDVLHVNGFGAKADEFGYEQGFTLTVTAPAEVDQSPALLSFESIALDLPGEIKVQINGKPVFEYAPDELCPTNKGICSFQVRLDPGIVISGENTIAFTHHPEKSGYKIRKLMISSLPDLRPTEEEQLQRWLTTAQRFYDERGIAPENVLTAKEFAGRALDLASKRNKAESAKAKAQVLSSEITKAFESQVREFWASITVAERLGHKDDMEKTLALLQRMYPNPESKESKEIRAKLATLKENDR